jgi:hypothetical protein
MLVALLALALAAPAAPAKAPKPAAAKAVDCRPCGAPQECQVEPSEAARLLAGKRRAMLENYPARIVDRLTEKLPACAQCLWGADEQTVDSGVQILFVEKSGKTVSSEWTKENELVARTQLSKGTLKAFYFVHLAEACTCCMREKGKWVRQTLPQQRRDWDKALGINKDAAVKFEKAADLGAEPADLKDAANREALQAK